MPRSQPVSRSRNWSRIVADILGSDLPAQAAAQATMRREVTDYVRCAARLPVGWLDDDDQARRTLARLVVQRLEAESFRLLDEWRDRVLRGRDHSSFWTMVKTVTWFLAIRYAADADR
jgi:hypothetical protein